MPANKKIAIFCANLGGGGAERALLNLMKGFVDENINVDLVLVRAEGLLIPEVPPQVQIVDLRASRTIFSIFKLITYLKNVRPYVLVSALEHVNIIAIWARWLSRAHTNVFITVHHPLSIGYGQSKVFSMKLLMWLVRLSYPFAHQIIAVSEGVRKDLAHYLNIDIQRITTIYNPIVHSGILQLADKQIAHPWFEQGQPPVIIAIGRLSVEKDYLTMIKAFQLVRKQRHVKLLILGEGDQKLTLETNIRELGLQDDISLPGFVSNPYPYLKKSSCFVLSSKFEGFGNVLVEALAVNCPVVSTDCPTGPSEILDHGQWGQLTPVGDETALANAIVDILDHKKLNDTKSLSTYLKRFSIDEIKAQYLNLFFGSPAKF